MRNNSSVPNLSKQAAAPDQSPTASLADIAGSNNSHALDLFSNADPDAEQIGDLYRKARTSVAESVRYLIEAGQRLARKKDEVGHGNWLPWLEANAEVLGFDDRVTAFRLMKAAASNVALAQHLDESAALQISREIWGHNVRGTQGTGENEWFTPAECEERRKAMSAPAKVLKDVRTSCGEILGRVDLALHALDHAHAVDLLKATHFSVSYLAKILDDYRAELEQVRS